MSVLRSSGRGGSLHDKIKTLKTLTDRLHKLDSPKKSEGTIFKRWGMYWKNLYKDYKEAAVDVVTECKERPIKSTIYGLGLAGGYYCIKNNPDERSYREDLLINEMKLTQVGESTRNPESIKHVNLMKDCINTNTLRRFTLGIFSIMWIDNSSKNCTSYKCTCNYLKPQIISLHERIADVGFINKWWILDRKMIDYDINNDEFANT
ncbi:mitochondrial import inner membrane translocase subunit Tim29 [Aphidius gifuensis]|nr:mitochondrial import inner membrane translocase subunit Tim29 [Aphidius gifuensis]